MAQAFDYDQSISSEMQFAGCEKEVGDR